MSSNEKEWSRSVAKLGAVPLARVTALLEACCDRHAEEGAAFPSAERTNELVRGLGPLVSYLKFSDCQHADIVLPEVLRMLPGLMTCWLEPITSSADLEGPLADIMSCVRAVLFSPALTTTLRSRLSSAVLQLLTGLIHMYRADGEAGQPPRNTAAAALMRALTRSPQFSGDDALAPLLPGDAAALLSGLFEPQRGTNLFVDSKPVVLATTAVRAMLSPPPVPLSPDDADQKDANGAAGTDAEPTDGARSSKAGSAVSDGGGGRIGSLETHEPHGVLKNGDSPSSSLSVSKNSGAPRRRVSFHQATTRSSSLPDGAQPLGGASPDALVGVAAWAIRVIRAALDDLLGVAGSSGGARSAHTPSNGAASAADAAGAAGADGGAAAGSRGQPGVSQAGAVARAAARLGAVSAYGLAQLAGTGRGASASSAALTGPLGEVMEVLVDVAEACVTAAGVLSPSKPSALATRDKLLLATGHVVRDAAALAEASRTLSLPLSASLFSSMRGALLAAASLEPAPGAPAAVWVWDVRRPLAASTKDEAGHGVERLCAILSEAVAVSLASAWARGQKSFVQAMLLLPDGPMSSEAEQQVVALLIGRVFMLTGCSEDFSRLALVSLQEGLMASASRAPAPAGTLAVIAHVTALMAGHNGRSCTAQLWTYEQVSDVLLRVYRDPLSPSGQLMMHAAGRAPPEARGSLAKALESLASDLRAGAAPSVRRDFAMRLLTLFSDLGLLVGQHPAIITDMCALLPSIAASVSGLGPHPGLGVDSTPSTPGDEADLAESFERQYMYTKLLRGLWMYVGVFTQMHDSKTTHETKAALGQIARATPVLLISEGGGGGPELLARLKVEFGDRLERAGLAADPARLRATLQSSYGLQPGASGGPPLPTDVYRKAYLIAIATCEAARATATPLPSAGAHSSACPVGAALSYLRLVEPASEDTAWVQFLTDRTFSSHVSTVEGQRRVAKEHAAAFNGAAAVPQLAVSSANGADITAAEPRGGLPDAAIERVALSLIDNLASSGDEGCTDGALSRVASTADRLLKRLLASYPCLYWSHGCANALLGLLDAEEGELPMGQARAHTATSGSSSLVWMWLQTWLLTAAAKAPSTTEALLHQFMGSSATPPLRQAPSIAPATSAALRRASELLSLCARARRQGGLGAAQDGTLALCRKQYYAGLAKGAAVAQRDELASDIAAHVAHSLDAAIKNKLSPKLVEERYLTAAALLATSPMCGPETAACYALLRGLTGAPLARFTLPVMDLATFAWTWIGTASEAWLCPLAAKVANAWVWTVDHRMGLFSVCSDWNDETKLQGLACHHRWLSYFAELWVVSSDRCDETAVTLSQTLSRLLHTSLADPSRLSVHPAAAAPRFRLLSLALRFAQAKLDTLPQGAPCPVPLAMLHDRVLKAAVLWFSTAPAFTANMSETQAQEQVSAVRDFLVLISNLKLWPGLQSLAITTAASAPESTSADEASRSSKLMALVSGSGKAIKDRVVSVGSGPSTTTRVPMHPVWGTSEVRLPDVVALLEMLLAREVDRLQVWAQPLEPAGGVGHASTGPGPAPAGGWEKLVRTAWAVDPQVAITLLKRVPTADAVAAEVKKLLVRHCREPYVQRLPAAAMLLASHLDAQSHLGVLATWAPAGAVEGLELLAGAATSRVTEVKEYALRCIDNTEPERLVFFLPQLVQILRNDPGGKIADLLLAMAGRSDLFAHQLIWALKTEEKPPEEAFNPAVKRSGWQPPLDVGLWAISAQLRAKVVASLSPVSREYWDAEDGYFARVTSISGVLYKYEKEERKVQCASELENFNVDRHDLYIPTNPDCRVVSHIPKSGTPMQSAAKVPILVAFNVVRGEVMKGQKGSAASGEDEGEAPAPEGPTTKLCCIFKVGDDVRQDVLALQVISLLKGAFTDAGLGLYLAPYGCIPTGYECGIIEVVPNCQSRAGLGELTDSGLYEIYQSEFGPVGSPGFEAARHNFIISEAGYAIASFLLQAKDRHNGNILIDDKGHLVHIDFGFILEISPGGNMGFESAGFKLSHEMTQLLDPGSTRASTHFKLFENLCVRGYLAARTVAEPIIAAVALMAESGLPCYGRGQPVENMRKRFHLEMSERQAAAFMRALIADAYDKWTTGFYDAIQNMQNRIPF
ncbi:hypothetical protein FOA52_004794 [Chlamydomonas sp. UWO 241]|nr:hypothetical protein FOA52_004794 [Chlamydomonas sp. UWO 241]